MKILGEHLKKERNKRGWTQGQVAEKLGLKGHSTYANWEYGNREPDTETLKQLANLFEVTVDYLIGDGSQNKLTNKDEKDIAKRMAKIREDLQNADGGLSFHGEPMSEEAMESVLEALEFAERTATKINKKYIPKKFRNDNE